MRARIELLFACEGMHLPSENTQDDVRCARHRLGARAPVTPRAPSSWTLHPGPSLTPASPLLRHSRGASGGESLCLFSTQV